MSRRFGRSKRRTAREAVAKAQKDASDYLRIAAGAISLQREAEARLSMVHREIERIASKHSALLPIQTTMEKSDPFEMKWQKFTNPPLRSWDAGQSATLDMAETILKKLRVKVVQDEIQRGLYLSVSFPGRGHCEIFVTDEALDYATAREQIAREIARRLLDELANGGRK